MLDIDKLISGVTETRIVPFFQPIVNVESRRVLGFEVLARLFLDGEYLTPEHFLSFVREKNEESLVLIALVSRTVDFLNEISDFVDTTQFTFSFNTSPNVLAEQHQAWVIGKHIAKLQPLVKQVKLEMLESEPSDNKASLRANMKALIEQGVFFSTDDFLTDYSNYKRLNDYPFKEVKIDKVFATNIGDMTSQKIIRHIKLLSDDLGFETVIEGIETKEQYQIARNLGVHNQ